MSGPLDFWLGSWDVSSPEGELLGTNEIVAELGGAAIVERWRGATGEEGMSLFYFDRPRALWKQVWVMEGGHKEKHLVADGPAGVVFQGTVTRRDGGQHLDRTTLTLLPDGGVRQVIEVSRDGGTTWILGFDGRYARAAEPSVSQTGTSDVEVR